MKTTKRMALALATVAAMSLLPKLPGLAQTSTPAGNAADGKAAFMKAACYACHGTVGQGGAGPRIAPVKLSLQNFTSIVRNGRKEETQSVYWDGMPAFSTKFVSDADLANIYAYLASIPAPPLAKDNPLLKN